MWFKVHLIGLMHAEESDERVKIGIIIMVPDVLQLSCQFLLEGC